MFFIFNVLCGSFLAPLLIIKFIASILPIFTTNIKGIQPAIKLHSAFLIEG